MNSKKCLTCGNPIVGRSDKKFCSDQCRYLENNKRKIESEQPILEVNRKLRKNRSILKSLCPFGKAVVRKEVMTALGYDMTIFSSLFLTSGKQVYYICYDYGFTPITEKGIEKALIITKQQYMNDWDPWRFVKEKDNGMKKNPDS